MNSLKNILRGIKEIPKGLEEAINKGNLKEVHQYISKGIHIDVWNKNGQTPLQLARSNGNQEIIHYLEELTRKKFEYSKDDVPFFWS